MEYWRPIYNFMDIKRDNVWLEKKVLLLLQDSQVPVTLVLIQMKP